MPLEFSSDTFNVCDSGRKRMSVIYCVTYMLSCFTKHSPQYRVLMLGRVLGGIATSLLFSSFESWLVAEHFKVILTLSAVHLHLSPSLFYLQPEEQQ